MSERDGTSPAVWDPTANGGAGGWVRGGAGGPHAGASQDPRAARPSDAEETAVLPPVPGTVPPPAGGAAEAPSPTQLDQPIARPYFPGAPGRPPATPPHASGRPTPFTPPGVQQPPPPGAQPPHGPGFSAHPGPVGADVPTMGTPGAQPTARSAAPGGHPGHAGEVPTVSAPGTQSPFGAGFGAPPSPQVGFQAGAAPFAPPGVRPGAEAPTVGAPAYAPNFQVPAQSPDYGVPGPPPFRRPDFGGPQPPPAAYTGADEAPRRMSTGVMLAIVIVVAAVLGVGAVWGLGLGRSSGSAGSGASPVASGGGSASGSTGGSAAPSGSPSGGASPSASGSATAGAQAQAQAVDSLLSQSKGVRQSIGSAATDVSGCTNLADAQGAFQNAANSRQSLANQATTLDVSQLPNGAALLQQLAQAERDSANADNAYASYAGSLASSGTCTPNAPLPQSVTAANTTATNDKNAFVVEWDQIAAQYGLPSWTKNDF
ncbi:hypothetical protein [Streptacidiphilus neutrinimicus]|uniref:hypothetical protein n=1 Tax=Streptacidiphilus neutrinimicus TaxID=105420 RepID=UPI0013786737|nr:hypothetical protein [Streptacidiphilus neutrinimicus]